MEALETAARQRAGVCYGTGMGDSEAEKEIDRAEARSDPDPYRVRPLICFTDRRGKKRFSIWDGECIELMAENGDRQVSMCHYLDDDRAEIDGVKWQMQAFAERMAGNGIDFAPLREL